MMRRISAIALALSPERINECPDKGIYQCEYIMIKAMIAVGITCNQAQGSQRNGDCSTRVEWELVRAG